ncbi:MAG: hypothetical protein LBQ16_01500 [Gracilibacteraceae bacterium]|nr:hypothetical protein [Gracilibacteraceae bacterium]
MRKIIAILAAVVIVTVFGATTAFAHGHQGGGSTAAYAVCKVESCTKTGWHTHNSVYYAAHYYGDGHNYHDYCNVAGCTLTGYHEHDGTYCFAHAANDGHSHNSAARNRPCH